MNLSRQYKDAVAAIRAGKDFVLSGDLLAAMNEFLQDAVNDGTFLGIVDGNMLAAELLGSGSPELVSGAMVDRAAAFAEEYTYELVKGINETTAKLLQAKVSNWLDTDQDSIDDLIDEIAYIFGPDRAELIAVTEVTRAISAGNIMAWDAMNEEYGEVVISGKQWTTANDDRVCAICAPLGGLLYSENGANPVSEAAQGDAIIASLLGSFLHPGGGGAASKLEGTTYENPPAHPGCRCTLRPIVLGAQL